MLPAAAAQVDSGIRNPHCALANVSSTVDWRRNLEAGIPGPTVLVMRFTEIDIQIDPLSLRRDFKFLIVLNVEAPAEEDFDHIPIPQFAGFG
jgi:hypothetical protein